MEGEDYMGKTNYDFEIYTDGGCSPNPGGNGGYGFVILQRGNEFLRGNGGYIGTTNNRMELMAAIVALESIKEPSTVLLHSDSKYLVYTMQGMYSKKKNRDLWNRLDQECRRHKKITFSWVRGHNGNKYNEICDTLATEGMRDATERDKGYDGAVCSLPARPQGSIFPDDEIEGLANTNIPPGYLNASCAVAIRVFKKEEKHSFRSYAKLTTGGRDGFSFFVGETLLDAVGDDRITELFFSAFPQKRAEAACRWYLRGLTVAEAFEKIRVDMEIERKVAKRS